MNVLESKFTRRLNSPGVEFNQIEKNFNYAVAHFLYLEKVMGRSSFLKIID